MTGSAFASVKRCFDELEAQGILVRRHGSGTFIRRVPFLSEVASAGEAQPMPKETLFAEAPRSKPRRVLNRDGRALNLLLLADGQFEPTVVSQTYRLFEEGLSHAATDAGHHLLKLSIQDILEHPERTSELAEQLKQMRIDGCLMRLHEKDALQGLFDQHWPMTLFFSDGMRVADVSPQICIDIEDALQRAVLKLHNAGHDVVKVIVPTDNGDHWPKRVEMLLRQLSFANPGLNAQVLQCDMSHSAATRLVASCPLRQQGVYVADDVLLRDLAPAFMKANRIPGRDFDCVVHATAGMAPPCGIDWSRIEFAPYQVGRLAMVTLLSALQTAQFEISSFNHIGVWHQGTTLRSITRT